ncbi:MAG TPA: ATP-binding protein, partial [Pyrinomonadaceae bacterium]|nr:ATP-binding protein [Pyrinomonadaceae bacterium]
MTPFQEPASDLSRQLQRLDALLHREILRLRATYQLSLDEFRGLYISDEQVNTLINRSLGYAGNSSVVEELTKRAEALHIAAAQSDDNLLWHRLVEEFSLSPLEQDILLLALAPEIDLKYETLYAYLNNDVTRKWPTRDLALRVFAMNADERNSARRFLAHDAALFRNGILRDIGSTPERPSWLASAFSLTPPALHYLLGIQSLDSRLPMQCESSNAPRQWKEVPVDETKRERLRRIVSLGARDQTFPLIIFHGREGSGRQLGAEAVCHGLGITLIRIDVSALRASPENFETQMRQVLLQQHLLNAGLYLEHSEAFFDQQGQLLPDAKNVIGSLAESKRPIFIGSDTQTRLEPLVAGRRAVFITFDHPDYSLRLRLWTTALARIDAKISESELEALADSFVLTPAQINAAVTAAADNQILNGEVMSATSNEREIKASSLFAAARSQSDQSLGNLAVKVLTIHEWADLVLPAVTMRRLREIAAAINHRHIVYSDWGFEHRIATGRGLKALFSGASGTGKTMTAGVIARELGLDVYKIDLSAIVSKYIGETEKNLDRIFRAAQMSNAILFFDEADALFGKRSEVKDAHDRYANIEVAYLLQKIEEYEGVVILASNLSKNIDEAFSRRMHYVVEFPLPDEKLRERLWRGMFPSLVPLDPDVDF